MGVGQDRCEGKGMYVQMSWECVCVCRDVQLLECNRKENINYESEVVLGLVFVTN